MQGYKILGMSSSSERFHQVGLDFGFVPLTHRKFRINFILINLLLFVERGETYFFCFCVFFVFFLYMLNKGATTELYPQSQSLFFHKSLSMWQFTMKFDTA